MVCQEGFWVPHIHCSDSLWILVASLSSHMAEVDILNFGYPGTGVLCSNCLEGGGNQGTVSQMEKQAASRTDVHVLQFPRIPRVAGYHVTLPRGCRAPWSRQQQVQCGYPLSAAALKEVLGSCLPGLRQHCATWPSPPVKNSPGSPGRCLEPAAGSITASLRGFTLPRLPVG